MTFYDRIMGSPLATQAEADQKVGPVAGIPMLGLDALSSAAYGPEAALTILLGIGALGASVILPITLIIVLLLGRFYGGVHLELWKWFAIFGVIWIGSLIFTALAIAIGYRYAPDTVQPIAMIVYLVMSVLGGLWFALSGFLATVGRYFPTYQITRIGTDIIAGHSIPMTAFVVIAAWFAAFLVLAVMSVRAMSETICPPR